MFHPTSPLKKTSRKKNADGTNKDYHCLFVILAIKPAALSPTYQRLSSEKLKFMNIMESDNRTVRCSYIFDEAHPSIHNSKG